MTPLGVISSANFTATGRSKNNVFYKELKPGDEPVAEFKLVEGDEVVAAYDYCNLHGFWKA